MTKITINGIDRTIVRYIDQQLQAKLDELGTELGLVIKIAGGGYTAMGYSPKLEMRVVDAATGQAKQDPYFLSVCASHGLDPNLISREGYKLVGFKPSRPKFPWDVQDRSGRSMKATRGWVDQRFKTGSPGSIPTISSQMNPSPARDYHPEF